MPVRLLTGNQSPTQILDLHPLLNVLVFSYVSVVIVVDVPVVTDLSVYTDRAEEQDQNNDRVTAYDIRDSRGNASGTPGFVSEPAVRYTNDARGGEWHGLRPSGRATLNIGCNKF